MAFQRRIGAWVAAFLGIFICAGAAKAADPASTVIAEAEQFKIVSPGWEAKKWGTNYYAATIANTFLSRKAYLGAPEQCDHTEATMEVTVPKAGTYLALVRYEAVYRFETQFRLRVTQGGKVKLDRLYGARDNVKIWAFKEGLKKEAVWSWGPVENVVWEGHDAAVELEAGPATLTLVADHQPGELAARRNVDLVMLTSDRAAVEQRLAKENYLPLDGMLTQAGDLYVRVHNAADGAAITLHVQPGKEHSPYWVHQRAWKPKEIAAKPGETTDWVEVGSLLDTLNDGQWAIDVKDGKKAGLKFDLEFGVPGAAGKIESIRRLKNLSGPIELAYDADTRYTHRVRPSDEVLYELVDYLKAQPITGKPPTRTLIYGYTFPPRPQDAKYTAALREFQKLMGGTALAADRLENLTPTADGLIKGYIDVRSVPTEKLEAYCAKLEAAGQAKQIAVVSMGDEIDLPKPPAKSDAAFVAWLKAQGLTPTDVDPGVSQDWSKIHYSPSGDAVKSNPGLHYYSKVWSFRWGIAQMKDRTEMLRRHLPSAHVGANFSPHGPGYLGDVHHWISVFREGGMTMPWGEDYIWQVPVGTQQMNEIVLDMFRAGVANHPDAKIQYYVMPHWPGNTQASWRRQFYGALAHGAKVINLFEFRPVQAAYTENHVSLPEMYQAVRVGIHELGQFDEIVQDGRVRPAQAGLWFSEAADVWNDNRPPFGAAKRTLYIAARHQQLPLDMVVEGDDLSNYKLIYLTDRHVSRAASKRLAEWVNNGGHLFATAGAGMRDEMDRPNEIIMDLLGVRETSLQISEDRINREKEDLPWAKPIADVGTDKLDPLPALGARSVLETTTAQRKLAFADGAAAYTVHGRATCCAFLPGLAYFYPAIPRRPLDRGTTDDSMAHFIPTAFNPAAARLINLSTTDIDRPVVTSEPLVENTVIESKHGTAIPLINWSGRPVKQLTVQLNIDVTGKDASLASGGKVSEGRRNGKRVFTLDLEVADALIIR
jgi:hypothetical protein